MNEQEIKANVRRFVIALFSRNMETDEQEWGTVNGNAYGELKGMIHECFGSKASLEFSNMIDATDGGFYLRKAYENSFEEIVNGWK